MKIKYKILSKFSNLISNIRFYQDQKIHIFFFILVLILLVYLKIKNKNKKEIFHPYLDIDIRNYFLTEFGHKDFYWIINNYNQQEEK